MIHPFPPRGLSDLSFWRSNWAAYTALEGEVTDGVSLGLAARYEDFSDFGSAFTWKFNGRVEFSDAIAIRGSVNTGFRAPTPGQSNVSSTFANLDAIKGAPRSDERRVGIECVSTSRYWWSQFH